MPRGEINEKSVGISEAAHRQTMSGRQGRDRINFNSTPTQRNLKHMYNSYISRLVVSARLQKLRYTSCCCSFLRLLSFWYPQSSLNISPKEARL